MKRDGTVGAHFLAAFQDTSCVLNKSCSTVKNWWRWWRMRMMALVQQNGSMYTYTLFYRFARVVAALEGFLLWGRQQVPRPFSFQGHGAPRH